MDAGARALQQLLSCELDIVRFGPRDNNAPFVENEFFSYPCNVFALNEQPLGHIQDRSYDLMLICGWHIKEYRRLARQSRGRSIRLLCIDNQWMGSPRQYCGMLAFRAYLRRLFDFAFVPGGRQARFASHMGFGVHEIIEGHYACADGFANLGVTSAPRSFLFVGRLVAEKGVPELAKAWRMYVGRNANPWNLLVCGTGPLRELLKDLPHVKLLGFVQPSELAQVMMSSSALVLPSLFEPWGVIVHEAAQAGLGLILTHACGAADYFLRDRLNGRLVSTGDTSALCEALEWFDRLDETSLNVVRLKSRMLSSQRSALSWACSASRAIAIGSALQTSRKQN
jgi:glycosyltransferase involved in cell wall biosynthesis